MEALGDVLLQLVSIDKHQETDDLFPLGAKIKSNNHSKFHVILMYLIICNFKQCISLSYLK